MDETGNTGRNLADPDQPIHLIVTVALDEACVMTVHDHVRSVAARHLKRRSRDDGFEFHGHALFAGSGHFAGLKPAQRIEIYDELLQAIAIAQSQVIVRGVYKPGLAKRYRKPYHPHDIALMFTIESIERLARDQGCHVLLVADESREIEDAALRDLASYQSVGTAWGWNTERIDHIIDTIHFVRSDTNPAIQLADCTAFIAARQRKIERGEAAENSAVTRLWEEHVEPYVWRNSVWFPPPPDP